MKGKLAGAKWLMVKGHSTIRNPDAFPVDIHLTSLRSAGGFLGTSTWEERTVKHRQFRLPEWIGNDDWEQAGIFVIHVVEFDTLIRAKLRQPQTPPMEEVCRYCQGDPWASGRKCRVGHRSEEHTSELQSPCNI